MSTETRQTLLARIRQQRGSGLHADITDVIRLNLGDLHDAIEDQDDTTAMLRTQGGMRALRQLLDDINPRATM